MGRPGNQLGNLRDSTLTELLEQDAALRPPFPAKCRVIRTADKANFGIE
jgi:hypothetical protein